MKTCKQASIDLEFVYWEEVVRAELEVEVSDLMEVVLHLQISSFNPKNFEPFFIENQKFFFADCKMHG